jgi:hypothetical protein
MENAFNGIVHNMMQVVDTPDLLSLSLAPMARTAKVFPLAGGADKPTTASPAC